MIKQEAKVFFMHIPKTAGSTFHHILFRQFTKKKHAEIRAVKRTPVYLALSPATKKKAGVVRGHFVFGLHRHSGDEGICLTFLRDPNARTFSGYEYIYTSRQHPFHEEMIRNQYSLHDFLDQKLVKNFDNIQVRFLCGDNSIPFGEVNEKHLEQAWENLMSDDVLFGLTERFDESVFYFHEQLGTSVPYYQKQNINKNKMLDPAQTDEKTWKKILEANRYDIELYERAKKAFEEKMMALGPGFAARVAAFTEANNTFEEPKTNFLKRLRNRWRIIRAFR